MFIYQENIMETIYLSQEGMDRLQAELKRMKAVERPAAAKAIAEAREKGDLSENAEYDAAKEAQGLLEAKIAELDSQLGRARVIDLSQIDQSKAMMFAKVRIKNLRRGAEMEYQLVSESEADLKAKKISVESPIGKGLLGKKVGDKAEVQTPAGTQEFEILGITYDF